MRFPVATIAALVIAAFPAITHAQGSVLLTMDEVPNQPIPVSPAGLTVKGVTFSCNVASCASYNALNGGHEAYVTDPSIEGVTAGTTLTITLGTPSTYLQFGVALSTGAVVPAGMTVQLKDPGGANIDGPISVNTAPVVIFSEGLFKANVGDRLIGSAVLTFNSAAAGAFAIDNLSVTPFTKFLRFFY